MKTLSVLSFFLFLCSIAVFLLFLGFSNFFPLSMPIFLFFLITAIFFFILFGGLKDFRSPFTMYSLLYFFSLIVGIFPFTIMYEFNPQIASLILAGYFMFIAGYTSKFFLRNKKIGNTNKYFADFPYLFYFMLIILGFIGLLLFYYQAGGIPILNRQMMENRSELLQGKGFGLQFFKFMAIPFLLLLAQSSILKSNFKTKLFTASLGLFCFLGLISTGFRSMAAEMVLMSIIVYFYAKNKRLRMSSFVKIAFTFIAFAILMSYIRQSSNDSSFLLTMLMELALITFVHLHNLSYILESFPISIPFQYGSTYLMNFLMIRPGADVDFTMWLKSALNIKHFEGGATPSIVGEFYLNFGLFGIFGMAFLGFFCAFLDKKLNETHDDLFQITKWAIISIYFFKTISGGISNVLLNLTMNLIVLEFIILGAKVPLYLKSNKSSS